MMRFIIITVIYLVALQKHRRAREVKYINFVRIKHLTSGVRCCIIAHAVKERMKFSSDMRLWRNRQTRTFEGRMGDRMGSSPINRTRKEKPFVRVQKVFLFDEINPLRDL